MPLLSARQPTLPPAVGYWTRGMTGSTSLWLATSKMWREPSSLPPRDMDTATDFPSGDGTNQSIAVAPVGSRLLGSTMTTAVAGLRSGPNTDSIGCCLGGWV